MKIRPILLGLISLLILSGCAQQKDKTWASPTPREDMFSAETEPIMKALVDVILEHKDELEEQGFTVSQAAGFVFVTQKDSNAPVVLSKTGQVR